MVPKSANYYIELVENLTAIEKWLKDTVQEHLPELHNEMAEGLWLLFDKMTEEATSLGLARTLSRLNHLNAFFDKYETNDKGNDTQLAFLVKATRDALEDDLRERLVFVPTLEQAGYYQKISIIW